MAKKKSNAVRRWKWQPKPKPPHLVLTKTQKPQSTGDATEGDAARVLGYSPFYAPPAAKPQSHFEDLVFTNDTDGVLFPTIHLLVLGSDGQVYEVDYPSCEGVQVPPLAFWYSPEGGPPLVVGFGLAVTSNPPRQYDATPEPLLLEGGALGQWGIHRLEIRITHAGEVLQRSGTAWVDDYSQPGLPAFPIHF